MARNPFRRRQPSGTSLVSAGNGQRLALPGPRTAGFKVASGRAIDVTDRKQLEQYRRRTTADYWQDPSWVFNATIPELGFAHDYVRDSLSRIRPFPAILSDDPDDPPIPLTDDTTPDGLDADLCDQLIQRLQPFPTFMGQSGLKLDIAGEVFVGLMDDPDSITGERCRVFSPSELIATGDVWKIRRYPEDSTGVDIPAGTPFWRIWTPDPQYEELPFSEMIRLSATCETLLVFQRLQKAFALSRLATNGSILAIADEFSLEAATNDYLASSEAAGDGEGETDPFMDDFMAAAAEAILDPESASAVMPLIVRGPQELIEKGIQVVDISRKMEPEMAKMRQELLERLASGLNLPREIILGIGATNHWNAEEITQQSWLQHLEPRAYNILAATTTAYYQPALLANDVDPDIVRKCCIWYDPRWFLGEPDRAESADFGYEQMLISGEAWRAAKNYAPEDAPADDEIEYRIMVQQRLNVRTTLRDQGTSEPPTIEPADTPSPDEQNPEDAAPDTPEDKVDQAETPTSKQMQKTATTPNSAPQQTSTTTPAVKQSPIKKPKAAGLVNDGVTDNVVEISAAINRAASTRVTKLGPKLVGIERDVRSRLMQAADLTVGRALERAGVKVRSKLSSRAAGQQGAALLTQFKDAPLGELPSLVGRVTVESFGLSDQDLLAGALGDLERRYHAIVKQAQHAALGATAAATGTDDVDYDQFDEDMDQSRNRGWTVLAVGLAGLAAAALYNPHPEQPDIGEYDGTSLVPPGLIRAALDAAGGAVMGQEFKVRGAEIPTSTSPVSTSTDVSGGATQGPDMQAAFKDQAGIIASSYVWIYGDAPRRPFPPHEDLDGTSFDSWEDDALANDEGFPDTPYFFPGDHNGCGCDTSVTYVVDPDLEDQLPGEEG